MTEGSFDIFLADGDFLQKSSALVLNADFRPLSYFPLSLWTWQDSIKASISNRVNILAEYDEVVRSPSVEIKIPSVVVLTEYIRPNSASAFTRFNLFLRDEFKCQYCGSKGEMTFDHIIPRSKGGKTTWKNVVASCQKCNLMKGSRSLKKAGLNLKQQPKKPDPEYLRNQGRKFPPNYLHESWMDYLYWDAELKA